MDELSLPCDIEDELRALVADDEERRDLTEVLGGLRAACVAPDELTAHRHVRAMRALAAETLGTSADRTVRRRPSKLRVVAASWVTAAAVVGGAGVAAATGALPGPLQHAVAGVTHAVGVDIPDRTPSHHHDGDSPGTRSTPGRPAGSSPTRGGGPVAPAPTGATGPAGAAVPSPAAGTPAQGGTTATTPGSGGASTTPSAGSGASADAPGHGATPPGQGGTPPGQITNPGQGNTGQGQGDHGSGNGANGNAGNGNSAGASQGVATTGAPPGQGGTPPGPQRQAASAAHAHGTSRG